MSTPPLELPQLTWKKRLSLVSLVCAVLLPLVYFGAVWWMTTARAPHDQDVGPFLTVVGLTVLAAFLVTIASIVAVIFDRRSRVAWIAMVLSVIESGAAAFLVLALRNLHF